MKLNKGEWSELYVGLLSLKDKNIPLYNSEVKLNVEKMGYELNQLKARSDIGDLDQEVEKLFQILSEKQNRTFAINNAELIRKSNFKKGISSVKADVYLDYQVNEIKAAEGFSIKSSISAEPTLLNASSATNFIFEIAKDKAEELNSVLKGKELLRAIKEKKIKITYKNCASDVFKSNLKKVDPKMDEFLAQILLSYYSGRQSKLSDLIESNFAGDEKQNIQSQVKNFLYYVTTGMFPTVEWDGAQQVVGCLIFKPDQALFALHRSDLDNFKNYLYNNSKLDTASTSRHDFGKIEILNDKAQVKLNLQIRMC